MYKVGNVPVHLWRPECCKHQGLQLCLLVLLVDPQQIYKGKIQG